MHSLINGFYQGWDLNPAQLPMRYAATYHFFLSNYDDALFRLKTFVERAAISTLTKDIFDDAATGQGLLNFFLKAINCGAISEEEVLATGLTLEEAKAKLAEEEAAAGDAAPQLRAMRDFLDTTTRGILR